MSDFKAMLKKKNNLDKFNDAITKQTNTFEKEEGYWQPTVGKDGNGFAVFRFLPAPPIDGDEGLPWVKYFEHGFKGPGGWYIELSRTSIQEQDPVSDYNTKLWDSGVEANRKIARAQKRKLRYVSLVQIINDPKVPENNGKVFKYRFGAKIFEKIKDKMNPVDGDTALDPFDLFEGANFKLKCRGVPDGDGNVQRNYDNSEFDAPTAHLGGDVKALEELYNNLPSLKELVAPEKFKDYATLKQRLDKVLGFDTSMADPTGAKVPSLAKAVPLEQVGGHAVTGSNVESVQLDDDDPALFDSLAK
jgi:hypothetical protein